MKSSIPTLIATAALALALAGCEVEQTEEGEAPDVDVEGGEAPEYDVDAPDVDVDMEEKTVTVPDVDVDMEKKRMKVPDVDINPADEEAADENPEAEEPPPDPR
jgi:hypothetical protein